MASEALGSGFGDSSGDQLIIYVVTGSRGGDVTCQLRVCAIHAPRVCLRRRRENSPPSPLKTAFRTARCSVFAD